MLTRCTHCKAVFRVYADQLRAAQCFARCGECGAQFDTLLNLIDEPVALTDDAHDNDNAEQTPSDVAVTAQGEAVPAILRADFDALTRASRRPQRYAWASLLVMALLALLVQVAWDKRSAMFVRFPATKTAMKFVCRFVGCDVRAPLLPADVELAARDVREHPQFQDALLVNATLISRARAHARFPTIELRFHDARGGIVGARRFAPHEYLDQSIDVGRGMSPAQPVHVVLEIASPRGGADSFAFEFY